ncbi:MAG TPA: methyltransferase domain-containing protein [Longimicrobiales bacterium]|nr:methyltransferase domain-containing protein [Longimicrobiales bacterium]
MSAGPRRGVAGWQPEPGAGGWPVEAMDAPDVDPALLADCLDHLARLTAMTGVRRRIASAIARIRPEATGLSVVDVGAGGGDVARYLLRRLGDRFALAVCVEPHRATAACMSARSAAEPRIRVLRGDALYLPLPDASVDIAMMNMALHHLPPSRQHRALSELGRVARERVLVTDLAANALNRIGARLLTATLWRGNPIVRADAPVSVERGYTRPGLAELARAAGLREVRVRSHFGHRLVLTASPP